MNDTTKTIKTIKTATTPRSNVVRLATAAVLAGMAVSAAAGTAAAAPGSPLPTFSGYGTGSDNTDSSTGAALDSLLLTARQAASTVGVGSLRTDSTSDHLADDSARISPVSCLSTYAPAEAPAYDGAQVQSVASALLKNKTTAVTQTVVALTSKKAAIAQLKNTADAWKRCANRTIDETTSTSTGTREWTNSRPQVSDDRTVLSMSQASGDSGQTCERAMAAYRNVVIDVMSCAPGSTDGQAVALVNAIAVNANSQSA